uniref:Myotubularin phosphatase domain-containing protein n=1 Tax=Cairina moschata TaxID=8855 RepID=A0A8C3CLP2_CAIMO
GRLGPHAALREPPRLGEGAEAPGRRGLEGERHQRALRHGPQPAPLPVGAQRAPGPRPEADVRPLRGAPRARECRGGREELGCCRGRGDLGGVPLSPPPSPSRPQRLCWHHPGGSDLLRSAGFHAASEPGSEDVRCLEALLRAGRGPCVLADTAELPTLADIQLAHLKLWALCLHGAAPEEKWLSALEATRWLDHVRACLRKAVEVASLLAGRRCCVLLQEPSDRDLNCLLASLVQLLADPHARTLPGFQSLVQREWVAAGHPFPRRLGLRRGSPREEAPVFPLFLDCTWQLVRQFPAAFGFTEAFLLALHDGGFQPYCGTFLFTCQRQRGRGGPVSGVRGSATPPKPPHRVSLGLGILLAPPKRPHPARARRRASVLPQIPPFPKFFWGAHPVISPLPAAAAPRPDLHAGERLLGPPPRQPPAPSLG